VQTDIPFLKFREPRLSCGFRFSDDKLIVADNRLIHADDFLNLDTKNGCSEVLLEIDVEGRIHVLISAGGVHRLQSLTSHNPPAVCGLNSSRSAYQFRVSSSFLPCARNLIFMTIPQNADWQLISRANPLAAATSSYRLVYIGLDIHEAYIVSCASPFTKLNSMNQSVTRCCRISVTSHTGFQTISNKTCMQIQHANTSSFETKLGTRTSLRHPGLHSAMHAVLVFLLRN
jgi:hypothetical protein